MRKIFLLLFLAPVLCFGKGKKNNESVRISEPVVTLNYAKGWIYDDIKDEWLSSDNYLIPYDAFTKFEFRTVTYKDREYLLLIKYYIESTLGTVLPPSETHTKANEVFCFLFDKQEYLSQLTGNDSTFTIKCRMMMDRVNGRNYDKDGVLLKNSIITSVKNDYNQEELPENSFYNVIIQFRNYKNRGISRFLIFYEECYKKEEEPYCPYIRFTGMDRWLGSSDLSRKLGTDRIYNWIYYECDYENFNNFITLGVKKEISKNHTIRRQ